MNYRTAKSRLTALIFLFLLFVPLPFIPEYGANTLMRLMLTTVLVEEDTTNVDTYAHLTIDRALIDGRYYADKAPGLSLIAVPAYAAGRWVANTLDERVDLLIETPHDIDERVAALDGSAGTVIFLRLVVWLTVGAIGVFCSGFHPRLDQRLCCDTVLGMVCAILRARCGRVLFVSCLRVLHRNPSN
jgi:hypothetical protein